MFTLVLKDWRLQRGGGKAFVYCLLMPVAGTFALSAGTVFSIMPFLAGAYMFVTYAASMDDKYRTESAFLSMPLTRRDVVLAKYLSVGSYVAAYFLILLAFTPLIRFFIPGFSEMAVFSASHAVQFITMAALYYSIFFPLYFKLGYMKSRWANYGALLASGGLFAAALKGVSAVRHIQVDSLQEALQALTGAPVLLWNIVLPILGAAAIGMSLAASVRIFGKREF